MPLSQQTYVRRHYDHIEQETACAGPIDVTSLTRPFMLVPIKWWDITDEGRSGSRGLAMA
ncbi:MAG: hypothetical protein EON58_11760 [Alphaproteobacteria bacterium]|nr:MAG: hypothetical protein EON58_11760 [Alphaproteobacteria bacterium]